MPWRTCNTSTSSAIAWCPARGAGRLFWALDECEVHRIRPTSGQVPERAWWRIKEARSLRGPAAAVAQVLAAWRERRAAELDRPIRFLLPDLALVAMAQRPPATEDDLRRVRGLDDGKKRGGAARELLAVVAQGLALPMDDVQLPRSEGVDRSRRAAASLVSAWAASEPATSTSTPRSWRPVPTSNRS